MGPRYWGSVSIARVRIEPYAVSSARARMRPSTASVLRVSVWSRIPSAQRVRV